ncbi:hypothetical protein [Kitasatospora sp. NPDC087314]|uniref:hypothetical protein n=1 Tax=Kitasatospora sp. NPDC087314 TaxID=3364068 RepID=UPI0037F67D85
MTVRLDQLPRDAASFARRLGELAAEIAQLRARQPDMSAADALLAPVDVDTSRWPQTTAATYTAIAASRNIAWKRKLRIAAATSVSVGTAGNVRISVNGTPLGTPVAAGLPLDVTVQLPATIRIGDEYRVAVEAQRTSGGGSVYAQVQLIRALD